jgi:hypothetical protein
MYFTASTTINANPETIWSIITDASKYPEWEPNVKQIEGTIAPGETVTAHVKSADRPFPAKVTEFVPNQKMTWTGGMPFGLFKGVRTFTLTPQGDRVDFTLREEFSGPMLFLIKGSIPDQTQDFQNFVAGLKQRAESMS